MLYKNAANNGVSLAVYTPFVFQPIKYSVSLSSFNSSVFNVG